jgi:acetate kinase
MRRRREEEKEMEQEKHQPMRPARQTVLTVNGGSSSIKFALFEPGGRTAGGGGGGGGGGADPSLKRILEGRIERIGSAQAMLHVKGIGEGAADLSRLVAAPDHARAADSMVDVIQESRGFDQLAAAGHRIVQGGPRYFEPQLMTAEVLGELRELVPLDPEHLPGEILLAESLRRRLPGLVQVACFDTAFHHDMPRVSQMLPIPRRYYQAQGVRRYGFHGLSYSFLMEELARQGDPAALKGRVILGHLGNGASLAAVRDGRPMDTSMGLTPAAGVPMGTRTGDLDPGLVLYLARTEKMTAEQFNDMVNFRSGLLGISETSSDMRDLLAAEGQDARAAEAVALFCYQVKKWIGAYAAALGGLDTLVFAGGIGENAPTVRARICEGLGFLGIEIDEKRNSANEGVISRGAPPGGEEGVSVKVIHTDEEVMLAKIVYSLLGAEPGRTAHEG